LISCSTSKVEPEFVERLPASANSSCKEVAGKIIFSEEQTAKLKKALEESIIITYFKNTLVAGQFYDVHVKGQSNLVRLKFVKLNEGTVGNNTIEFSQNDKILVFNLNQLNDVALVIPEKKPNLLRQVFSQSLNLAILAEQFSRLMFKPFKTVFKNESFEVVTNLTSKSLGVKELAKKLESFDESMMSLGLNRPEKTRIVINDNPFVPSITGPVYVKAPTLNLWRGRLENLIVMNPIMKKTAVTKAPGALFHERSHSFLYRSFKRSSFVNSHETFQEAFADFFSARFMNDPIIAKIENDMIIRNISLAKPNITMARQMGYHDRSVFISSLLWNGRMALGSEKFDELLMPILDNLNRYRNSFLTLENAKIKKTTDHTQLFIYEYEYFLSVMLKTFNDHQSEIGAKLVKDYIAKFELDSAEILRIEKQLQQSSESFEYDGKGEFNHALLLMGLGTAGVSVEGYLIYELLN
jgi:hypothetical protein